MARIRRFNDYSNNEYTPSWVEPDEREEQRIKKWVEGDKPKKKKAAPKKKSAPKKTIKHNGNKSHKKYYAVRKGKQSKVIVESWAECSKLVTGYSGAIYKGFSTKEEAEAFIKGK